MIRTLDLRRPSRTLGTLGVLAVLGGPLAMASGPLGCARVTDDGPQVANPQRQAESEYDLARDAFYKGHLREALDHCERADKLDDSNAKALYFTAAVYLGFCSAEGMESPDCRLATAEEFTRRAIKAEPDFRDAKNTLGQVLILEKRYDEALRVLEPLTKDPAYGANYLAWGNYGEALVELGRIDEGIAALRNSVTEPRFCTGHYRLGVAYEKKGDFVSAEKSFSDALNVPIADCQALQDAWFERAQVRLKLGKMAEAQGDFARCREVGSTTERGRECAMRAGASAPTPVKPIPTPARPAPPATVNGTTQESTTSAQAESPEYATAQTPRKATSP